MTRTEVDMAPLLPTEASSEHKERSYPNPSDSLTRSSGNLATRYSDLPGTGLDDPAPFCVEKNELTNAEKIKKLLEEFFSEDTTRHYIEIASAGELDYMSNFIGDIVQYAIIFPSDTKEDLKAYAQARSERYQQSGGVSPVKDRHSAEYITNRVAEILHIDPSQIDAESERIAKYVYSHYVQDGFVFHGFNSAAEHSILEHGLSGEIRVYTHDDIDAIDQLFKRYGISRITGWHTLNSESAFFVSEDPSVSYDYAARAPEWFSSFSGGSYNYMGVRAGSDRLAFTRRDHRASLGMIDRLMEQKKFTELDRKYVREFFEKYWQQLALNTTPKLALIKRSALDSRAKDDLSLAYSLVSENYFSNEPKSTSDIVHGLLSLQASSDRRVSQSVDAKYITIVDLPPSSS